ncbi:MAG: hypothetical protein E7207_03520 [Clostridium butyricum]|nr:hypothetical protein [Clostridium butyricum]
MYKKLSKFSVKKCIYFLSISILGIIFITIYNQHTKIKTDNEAVTKIELTGFYQDKESYKCIPFDNINDINTDSSEITIMTYIKNPIPKGSRIIFYMRKINLIVLINGEEVYKSDEGGLSRWDSFESPGIMDDDQITFILKKTSEQVDSNIYKCVLDRIYYGSNYGMIKHKIKEQIIPIEVCFLISSVGIIILTTAGVFKFFRIDARKGYLACGLLLITGALCTLNNYEYITLIFNNPALVNIFDLVSEAFVCEFLLIYLKTYIHTEEYLMDVNIMARVWPAAVVLYFLLEDFQIMHEDSDVKMMLTLILVMFFREFVYLIKDYFKYKSQSTKYVLMSGIILLIATVIEIIHFYLTNIFWIYVFQAGLLMFTFVQICVLMNSTKDKLIQAERSRELEAELVQKNVAIMLSQIQPHFLYNSLTSIGYLCEKEPKTARKLLNQFSDYLRVNMDSLKMNKPVTFSKELDHVKTYLHLEKMRFDDDLHIEYEIETVDFMIPALTVQPIVENAVKHGIGKKENGGTIKLLTKEMESEYVVIVQDDGVGFNSNINKNDNRTHIGIENVKKRLESMSGGKLSIESKEGLGTTVKIKIPKGRIVEEYEDNSSR